MGKLTCNMTSEEIGRKRATGRAYYAANREKVCAQRRVSRGKHREETNAKCREKARRRTPEEKKLTQIRKKAYYLANRDEILRRGRARAVANKGNTTKIKKNQLWQKFKITLEDWEQMYNNQKGVCAICGEKCRTGKDLSVDHNHKTGKVRSLLCQGCNAGIGMFQDNSKLLIIAAKYLIDHEN